MRQVPDCIAKELKRYHPSLGMVWDTDRHVWMFTANGKPSFMYRHVDGTPCRTEPVLGEVEQIVREADNSNRLGDRVRDFKRAWSRLRDRRERDEQQLIADAKDESRAMARHAEGHTKPTVSFA